MEDEIDQSAQEVEQTEDNEVEAKELESQSEADFESDTEETEVEPEEELEEIEFGEKKYKVAKELKDAFLMQQDYTRKTQEVADNRRMLESAAQEFQQRVQAQQQNIQAYANLAALDQQLTQYQNVDFQAYADQDPVAAQKAYMGFQQLKGMRDNLANQISTYEQQMQLRARQEIATRTQEGMRQLHQEIKDWSPQKAQALKEYGKTQGFQDTELDNVLDPRAVKLLHKAYMYDQMMTKATQKPKQAEQKPVPKVGGKTAVTKDPSQMSPKEFAVWRKKQIASR